MYFKSLSLLEKSMLDEIAVNLLAAVCYILDLVSITTFTYGERISMEIESDFIEQQHSDDIFRVSRRISIETYRIKDKLRLILPADETGH